jgi:D-sedoheptulose 7-phosphate isomerase
VLLLSRWSFPIMNSAASRRLLRVAMRWMTLVVVCEDHHVPAISLVNNAATLIATPNDFGYETISSRQVRALGRPGDVLFAKFTSGNRASALKVVKAAQAIGITVVGLTNTLGGLLGKAADVRLRSTTLLSRITEEVHLLVLHMIANRVARLLVPSDAD